MGVLSDRRLRWLLVAFGVVTVALVGVVGLGTFALLSALASLGPGEFVLAALLEAVVPYLLSFLGLGVVAAGLVAWSLLRAVRVAELPRSDRLAWGAERVERAVPMLGDVGVSDALSPTAEDRREALKERYARGEVDEYEFERGMAALLDDEVHEFDDEFDDLDDRLDAVREESADADGAGSAGSAGSASDAEAIDDAAFREAASDESPSTTERERR